MIEIQNLDNKVIENDANHASNDDNKLPQSPSRPASESERKMTVMADPTDDDIIESLVKKMVDNISEEAENEYKTAKAHWWVVMRGTEEEVMKYKGELHHGYDSCYGGDNNRKTYKKRYYCNVDGRTLCRAMTRVEHRPDNGCCITGFGIDIKQSKRCKLVICPMRFVL